MRAPAIALFLLLATFGAKADDVDSSFAPAAQSLKDGNPALARSQVIELAQAILDQKAGPAARLPLQRAALYRAYAERALHHDTDAEWYWWMAKELSVGDDEMKIVGFERMTFSPRPKTEDDKPSGKHDITAPQRIRTVDPVYPREAREQHIEQTVVIEALIDITGVPHEPHVMSTPREPELEYAAMEALSQWRYKPGLLDGKAVPAIFTLTMKFHLEK